jgi:hypothetical protein
MSAIAWNEKHREVLTRTELSSRGKADVSRFWLQ